MKPGAWQFARGCRFLLLAIAVTVAVGWMACGVETAPHKAIPNGGLIVDKDDLNLGDVWEQDRVERIVRISNPTLRRIEVEWLYTSCACTSVEPRTFAIEAGEEQTVRVTLDLTSTGSNASKPADAGRPRDFEFQISPQVRGVRPAATQEWTLAGTVHKAFLLDKTVVDFGDMSNLSAQRASQTLRVKFLAPVASFAAQCDPSQAAVAVGPLEGEEGWRTVNVSLADGNSTGRFEFDLKLDASTENGERLPTVPVRVTGRRVDDVRVVPSEVTFGTVRVGESAVETVTLSSLTGRPFTVKSNEANVDGLTVLTSQSPGGSTACRVVIRPSREGASAACVQFEVSIGNKSITVPLHISYVGIAKSEGPSPETDSQGANVATIQKRGS